MARYPKRSWRRRSTRRRTWRRKSRKSVMSYAQGSLFPHRFVRYTGTTLGVGGAVGTGYGALSINLAQLPSYTEFTNLFDQYRIVGMKYRFRITFDPMLSAATKNYPTIVWAIDRNDSTAPGNITDVQQYQKVSYKTFGDSSMCTKWHYVKPYSSLVGYETAVLSAYNAKFGNWWDTADSATAHNTFKYAYDSLYTGVSIYCDYAIVFECRGVK